MPAPTASATAAAAAPVAGADDEAFCGHGAADDSDKVSTTLVGNPLILSATTETGAVTCPVASDVADNPALEGAVASDDYSEPSTVAAATACVDAPSADAAAPEAEPVATAAAAAAGAGELTLPVLERRVVRRTRSHFTRLPRLALATVVEYLGARELRALQCTCGATSMVVGSKAAWRQALFDEFGVPVARLPPMPVGQLGITERRALRKLRKLYQQERSTTAQMIKKKYLAKLEHARTERRGAERRAKNRLTNLVMHQHRAKKEEFARGREGGEKFVRLEKHSRLA